MDKTIYTLRYAVLLNILIEARVQVGLSQTTLAERLGRVQSFVGKVEGGSRRLDYEELRVWWTALGLPFQTFHDEYARLSNLSLPTAPVTRRRVHEHKNQKVKRDLSGEQPVLHGGTAEGHRKAEPTPPAVLTNLLTAMRVDTGLSQTKVAELLDERQSFISDVERGARRIDYVELQMWCAAIDISFQGFHDEYARRACLARPDAP